MKRSDHPSLPALLKENAELRAEIERLQKALAFWMPGVPAGDKQIAERAGNDAWLLAGLDGNEPSAEELGWITLRSPHIKTKEDEWPPTDR